MMKPSRTETIVDEIHASMLKWLEYAKNVKRMNTWHKQIQRNHRLVLPVAKHSLKNWSRVLKGKAYPRLQVVPCGLSSKVMPTSRSSLRIRSASAKFLFLRAARRF